MKKIVLLFWLCTFYLIAWSQTETEKAIQEGIDLHDKGDYTGAIAKYDQALQEDQSNYKVMYEKSFSLIALKMYDQAEELVKGVLKKSRDPEYRVLAYINYGTIKDYQGLPGKSIEIYNKGIKEFPGHFLLHFNKGITLNSQQKPEEALVSFKNAVRLNPMHASSHYAIARLVGHQHRIPALLSLFSFLLIERQGSRATKNAAEFIRLLTPDVTKNENGNVTINIDMSLIDPKNKKKEDDFSSADLMMSLIFSDSKVEDSLGLKTIADKLGFKMQSIINVIDETSQKPRGFFKSFYVPMVVEMKKKELITTAVYVALSSTKDSEVTDWLEQNKEQVDSFYAWFKNYQWVQ